MDTVSPGIWNGLRRVSDDRSVFTIVAFDQRDSYLKILPKGATYDQAVSIKTDVGDALSPHSSAILLDPEYGLAPAQKIHRNCGLLMALEQSGYSGDSTYRHTEMYSDWSVEKIKNMGASAVKVLVYYNPEAGELAEEIEQLSRQVAIQCKKYDIPYFLEPIIYSVDADVLKMSPDFAKKRPELICETAKRLGNTGATVLKMEFPVDAQFDNDRAHWLNTCKAVSQVSPVPWVLLSAGVDFDVFEQQVKMACEGGASGFLGGRAIWKESVSMPPDDRRAFLRSTGVQRLQRLSDIADACARPWTDFYAPWPAKEHWFADYMC